MKVEYNFEDDTIKITIETDGTKTQLQGFSETIPYEDFLDLLPDEKVKLQSVLQRLYGNRKNQIDKLGDISSLDISIMKGIAKLREQIAETDEENKSRLNKLNMQIKAFLSEKDMLREMRHVIKLYAVEEGKLLAELEKLEV